MTVKVTIGLCVKDSERTIRRSIESIVKQNYPLDLIQLIVVDGASKDKTLSIIKEVISKTAINLEIFSDAGKGLGTARQIVVDNAQGQYIIFVDADITVFSDFITTHMRFMEANPDLGAAFGTPMFHEGPLVATLSSLAIYTVGGGIGAGASICRSKALHQIGGFDTKIKGAAEDRDLFVRLRLNGWQLSVNKTARYFHKHRGDLCSFWTEQSWFGYGDHYFNHKYRNISNIWRSYPTEGAEGSSLTPALFGSSVNTIWHRLPIGEFIWGLKLSSRAYKRTHKKLSFLILPQMMLGNISWWVGFAKAHRNEYGH